MVKELTGENNSTIKKPQIQSQQQQIHQNDREMLLKVWQVIWSNYDSIPFRYPVDPSVPGYYAIIKNQWIYPQQRSAYLLLQDF